LLDFFTKIHTQLSWELQQDHPNQPTVLISLTHNQPVLRKKPPEISQHFMLTQVGLPKRPPKRQKGVPPSGFFYPSITKMSYNKLRLLRQGEFRMTQVNLNILQNYYTKTFRNIYLLVRTKVFINTSDDKLKIDPYCSYYNNTSSFFEKNKLPFYHSSA